MIRIPRTAHGLLMLLMCAHAFVGHAGETAKAAPTGSLLSTQKQGGIVYFLFESEERILRYDTHQEIWLSDLALSEIALTMATSDRGLYVGYDRRMSHISVQTGEETRLRNFSRSLSAVFTYDDYVYGVTDYLIITMDGATGAQLHELDIYNRWRGASVAPSIGKVFGQEFGGLPTDIVQATLNVDGSVVRVTDSIYHGDYPLATKNYVFPAEGWVADNAGTVYTTSDLTYAANLGGAFDNLDFYGNLPIVLRDGVLISYANTFAETGRHQPAHTPETFVVEGNQLFSFYRQNDTLVAENISLDLLTLQEPGLPVDPNGLQYEPADIAMTGDGTIYLLSPTFLSIFRWSTSQQRYLDTITLTTAPSNMTYSEANHTLYLGYADRKITRIALDDAVPTEELFGTLPKAVQEMGMAGDFLYVVDADNTSATDDSYLFDLEGNLVTSFSSERIDGMIWDEDSRRIYTGAYRRLSWLQIGEAGEIVDRDEEYFDYTAWPILLSPDSTRLMFGWGEIFKVEDLDRASHNRVSVNALSSNITHGQWRADDLTTLSEWGDGTQIQQWNLENFEVKQSHTFEGKPLGLYPLSDGFLVITATDEGPAFFSGDASFQGFPETPNVRIDFLTTSKDTIDRDESITLSWNAKWATSVFLDGEQVPGSGERRIFPGLDTTYRLVAKGKGADAHQQVSVKVAPALEPFGFEPPLFLNSKNLWLADNGDLNLLLPDPNADGASSDQTSRPRYYHLNFESDCRNYTAKEVGLGVGETWPKLLVIPTPKSQTVFDGDYKITIRRSTEKSDYRGSRKNWSDKVVIHAPTVIPDASAPPTDYAAYDRWLLHAPKQSGGFSATIKIENPMPETDSQLQLVAFDTMGNMLGAEPIVTGAGQTTYHPLYGGDGLFANLLDQVSHIAIHDPKGSTAVSLRYTADSSQFSAWTREVDLRRGTALGGRLEMESRTTEEATDGVAVLNLKSDEPVRVWLAYRDRDTSEVINEVDLGTVAPGGKLLALASHQFNFRPNATYTIETRDPEATISVLGLVFVGGDFFTTVPVHQQ